MGKEQYNKIKELSRNLFTNTFLKFFFNNDFKLEILSYQAMIANLKKKEDIIQYIENLDIILKLIGYRLINSTNTSLIKSIIFFLDSLYLAINSKYILNDIEYNIIFTILIEKLCINNNSLKEKIICLLNQYIYLLNPNKIIQTLIDISINKNNKIKTEIIDIIIDLFKNQDLNIDSKNFISTLNNFYLSNEDKIIKTKCIFLFKELYLIHGKNLWNLVKIEDKMKQLIEEEKNKDIEINITQNSSSQLQKNKSYKDKNISKELKTQNNSDIIKNEKNKIFYNTSINFNPNNFIQNKDNFDSKEKNLNNKLKVKKIHLIKQKLLMKDYSTINKSINNSFNNNENRFYDCSTYNSNDKCNNSSNYNDSYYYFTLTKKELISKMNNLLSEDYKIKNNSIIILHEILCSKYEENKNIILNNIEQIFDIFTQILKDLFSYIPRIMGNIFNNNNSFSKYIVIILCNLLSKKEILINISYKTIYNLLEIFISFLINENFIKENEIIEDQEIILNLLKSSMKKILDNYKITSIILILLELITNYYNKNNNLFISTILKYLKKKMENIDQFISDIEIDAILLQIHLLLIKLDQNIPELESKNEIFFFIKKFLFYLIDYKKESILEDYNRSVKCHFISDKYIINWINEFIIKNKEKKINGKIFNTKLNNNKKSFKNLNNNKKDKKVISSFSTTNIGKFKDFFYK